MKQKIREIVWLIAFVVCVLTGIHQTWKEGFAKSYMFFVFAIFAFMFFYMRYLRRKNSKNV